jgi:peptidoglycan LD-endopeptidase LytH
MKLLAAALLVALPFQPRSVLPPKVEPLPEPPRGLMIPVDGVKARELQDTFRDSRRGGHPHDAIDIMAPQGRPVLAVDDGTVVKLFKSVPGGLTIYQFDEDETFAYYYAHLDRYAVDLAEGRKVKRGEVIGYVGYTGNANPAAPHLHFAIFVLGPQKRWWQGTAINPYPSLGGR